MVDNRASLVLKVLQNTPAVSTTVRAYVSSLVCSSYFSVFSHAPRTTLIHTSTVRRLVTSE